MSESPKAYALEKKLYLDAKKGEYSKLRAKQKREREELFSAQRKEREGLYRGSNWQGNGKRLNAIRSILAASQAAGKADMRDRHKDEQREWRESYKPFPDYPKWLFERDDEGGQQFSLWKYRKSRPILSPGEPLPPVSSAAPGVSNPKDIRAYEYIVKKDGVAYLSKKEGKTSFIDHGRQITVTDWRSRETILASLQLAVQKWGSVSLTGSEEYKGLCVSVCVAHNINVTNPELRERIETEKQRIAEERAAKADNSRWGAKTMHEDENFKRYSEAVGAERYRVTILRISEAPLTSKTFQKEERRGFILDKDRETGESRGFTPEELHEKIGYMRYRQNTKGDNIYYTPLSETKRHLLIDDMTQEKLDKFLSDGYKPAAIIESSPGNFQAILTVPKTGAAEALEKEAANVLASTLNATYGDPKVKSAVQAHRAPGFQNRKPKHRREDGTYPGVVLCWAERIDCGKALEELKAFAREIERKRETAAEREREYRERLMKTAGTAMGNPEAAYRIHARDIVGHFGGDVIPTNVNYNQVDSMAAVRMRVTGYTKAQVEEAIKNNAASIRPADRRDSHNWERYAARTATYAFENPKAESEVYALSRKRGAWMVLEGRTDAARNPPRNKARGGEGVGR
ncbi:MAG: hypothetical protein LBQ42_14290 [Synergistaceae bacterium]|nr:hypothetical protein [Synergistaceae bacterium]